MDAGILPEPPEAPADPLTITAVVPTLNEERRLPGLLASLRSGDPEDGVQEIVVSDGGSHDGTVELALRYGARLVSGATGRGGQLARGALEGTGELLFFVHADAEVAPGSLRAVREAFRDGELLAAALRQSIDSSGSIFRAIERMADLRARFGWVYGDSGLVCRRSAYERVGGYRELPIFEDLDLSRRLRRAGALRLVPGARVKVSPRRWQLEGPLRRTFKNWCLTLAWVAGVAPERLVRFYRPHPSPENLRENP